MKSILTVTALEAKLKPNLFYILYQQYIIMTNLFKSLYFQVLIAIAIGIALGHFYPAFAVQLKPPGDGFIKFIR